MTLEDILNSKNLGFKKDDLAEFIKENKDHIISGSEYCDDHNLTFYDLIDGMEDILKANSRYSDLDVKEDSQGNYMATPDKDDMREAFDTIFTSHSWRNWCRKMSSNFDIPFYKDEGKVTVLPFVAYTNDKEEISYIDLDSFFEIVLKASELDNTSFDFSYTYDYGHNQIEEWWEDGEGFFMIEVDYPTTEQIRAFFKGYQEEVDRVVEIKASFLIEESKLIEYALSNNALDIKEHFFKEVDVNNDFYDSIIRRLIDDYLYEKMCLKLGVSGCRNACIKALEKATDDVTFDGKWEWEDTLENEAVRLPVTLTVDKKQLEYLMLTAERQEIRPKNRGEER